MKGKTFKRVIAVVMALAMIGTNLPDEFGYIGLFDGFVLPASAADTVTYTKYSWNDTTKTLSQTTETKSDYTVFTADLIKNNSGGLLSGTYVVNANTTIEEYVYIRKKSDSGPDSTAGSDPDL